MSTVAHAGPLVVFGQVPTGLAPTPDYNPNGPFSPAFFNGGTAYLDQRSPYGFCPGQSSGSTITGFATGSTLTYNYAPAAGSGTALSTAHATTANTAIALVTANSSTTGVGVGLSIARADTGATVTGLLGLDTYTAFSGYISNGTSGTAGNLLIATTASAIPLINVGMTLTSGTSITTGTAITLVGPNGVGSNKIGLGLTGVYTVNGAAQAAGTSGSPLSITALQGGGLTNAILSCQQPFGSSNSPRPWNPSAMSARAVSVTPVSANPTGNINFTVSGYDVYGFPQTETIALTSGSTSGTAVNGKKAFKYIAAITPDTTDTVTYSAGTTNIFGFPLRSDSFGDVEIYYAASLNPVPITSASNYVAADTTPATATTGDVRGTFTSTPSAGANRFVFVQMPPIWNIASGTQGLFGVTPA